MFVQYCFKNFKFAVWIADIFITKKNVFRRTSRSSGEGAPRVEALVASRFAYEVFPRSTSSSLKPKTLVQGPFDGSRTV